VTLGSSVGSQRVPQAREEVVAGHASQQAKLPDMDFVIAEVIRPAAQPIEAGSVAAAILAGPFADGGQGTFQQLARLG
jgi:hypothetical protein